jgi:hypothetical protein
MRRRKAVSWYEHHKRNAQVTFWIGVVTFLLGLGAGGYELWNNHKDLSYVALSSGEIWLLSLLMFGLAFRYKKKAELKKDIEEPRSRDFFFHEQEIMIKQLGGLDLCYQYFTIDGDLLLEFKEKRKIINKIFDLILNLGPFLNRTFYVSDAEGTRRLILKQKAGLNSPIDVFLPSGEKISRYRMGLKKFRITVEDEKNTQIVEARGEQFAQKFTMRDSSGSILMEFWNRGLPSKNQSYFTMSDDLIRFQGNWTSNERLYLQIIAVPAIIKMNYRK